MQEDELLSEVRKRVGSAPRRFSLLDRNFYLNTAVPAWAPRDDLRQFYQRRDDLLRTGHVVWGAIIQANGALFEPGPHDLPGEVVYAPDPEASVTWKELLGLARQIGALKGGAYDHSGLANLSNYLANELIRVFGLEVPAVLNPRVPSAISTVMFTRSHLPSGVLTAPVLPLFVYPGEPRVAMPVPSRYWPQGFLNVWNRKSE